MSLVGRAALNHPQQVAARFNGNDRRWHATESIDDRATTPEVFGPLNDRFAFTIDVAAATHNAKCDRFYDQAEDGLQHCWARESVWCNPPFSNITPWIEKAWDEWNGQAPPPRDSHASPRQPHRADLVARARRAAPSPSTPRLHCRVPTRPTPIPQTRRDHRAAQ